MVALSGFTGLWELANLAHAPLLTLLAEMAARQGMSWYKERLRSVGQTADSAEVVAGTADDLPEKALPAFKRVLGNSEKAVPARVFQLPVQAVDTGSGLRAADRLSWLRNAHGDTIRGPAARQLQVPPE